jgi:hypothetical protein
MNSQWGYAARHQTLVFFKVSLVRALGIAQAL